MTRGLNLKHKYLQSLTDRKLMANSTILFRACEVTLCLDGHVNRSYLLTYLLTYSSTNQCKHFNCYVSKSLPGVFMDLNKSRDSLAIVIHETTMARRICIQTVHF